MRDDWQWFPSQIYLFPLNAAISLFNLHFEWCVFSSFLGVFNFPRYLLCRLVSEPIRRQDLLIHPVSEFSSPNLCFLILLYILLDVWPKFHITDSLISYGLIVSTLRSILLTRNMSSTYSSSNILLFALGLRYAVQRFKRRLVWILTRVEFFFFKFRESSTPIYP